MLLYNPKATNKFRVYLQQMNLDLSHKTALVCGSTQGIGKASALELSKLGANIILCARNEAGLKQVLTELDVSKHQKHSYLVADFNKPELLEDVLKSNLGEKSIQILVNNTGGPNAGTAIGANTHEFLNAFNQHLICNHILTQWVVESMKKEKYGRIINIISTSVKVPLKGLGVSNTIRGAVANWAKTLSIELAPFGITVNNVLPGATSTERLKNIIQTKSEKTKHSITDVEQDMRSEIPLGRFAEPSEIANAVAFLASPAAAYINGINLPVDGGRTGSL